MTNNQMVGIHAMFFILSGFGMAAGAALQSPGMVGTFGFTAIAAVLSFVVDVFRRS